MSAPILRVDGLSAGYRSGRDLAQVLLDVTLELTPGRIVGLAGESGSGKSTLGLAIVGYVSPGMATLAGAVRLGDVALSGAPVSRLRPLWGPRLAYMPQDTANSLNPALTVGTQFREILRRHRGLRSAAALAEAELWLGRVELPAPRRALQRYPHQFSGGQQQRIALALALSLRPGILVLDEPTTGLDVVTQAEVNRLIVGLVRDAGTAALYVSHNLALLAEVCDELAVMYAGQIVEQGSIDAVFGTPQHPYTVALMDAMAALDATARPRGIPGIARTTVSTQECGFADRCALRSAECLVPIALLDVGHGHLVRCIRPGAAQSHGPAIESIADAPEGVEGSAVPALMIDRLTCSYRGGRGAPDLVAVNSVSVDVPVSRTLGIAGESGSGKSTLLRAVAGLIAPSAGTVSLQGEILPARAADRNARVRGAIQIVFQNPDATLNPRHTIAQSLERPLKLFRSRLDRAGRGEAAVAMMRRVHLSPDLLRRYPSDLSGGQRQRVAIARCLLAEPIVLLCDEVTSALDVSVQASIIELLDELRHTQQLTVVFVTHDLGVLKAVADEAVVMRNGMVCERGPIDQVLHDPQDPYTRRLIAAVPSAAHRGGMR